MLYAVARYSYCHSCRLTPLLGPLPQMLRGLARICRHAWEYLFAVLQGLERRRVSREYLFAVLRGLERRRVSREYMFAVLRGL